MIESTAPTISTALQQVLQSRGQLQQGAQAVSVGEGMICLLEHGHLDLFLRPIRADGGHAARFPWLSFHATANAAQLVFSPLPQVENQYQIVISASPDVRYWLLSRQDFAALWQEGGELWQHLLSALQTQLHDPESVEGKDGNAVLQHIDAALSASMEQAYAQHQQNEIDELGRLQQRSENSRQAMAQALGGLASLFGKGQKEVHVNDDAVLAACRAIGAEIGIDFKAPHMPQRSDKRRDLIKDIAHASRVRWRVVALKAQWWAQDNGALLVFTEKDYLPLALLRNAGKYQIFNPADGSKQDVTPEVANDLARFGYMFYPHLPSRALSLGDVFGFAFRGLKPEISWVLLIGLANALLWMAIPIASGHLFDNVFPAADHGQMVEVILVLFIASVVNLLFETTRAMLVLRIEARATNDLQAAVWDRVLNLPTDFFRQFTAGDLATRINGINEIRQALSGSLIATLIGGVFSIVNIFLMFYYSFKLGMLALLLVMIAMGVNFVIAWRTVRVTREATTLNGKVTGRVLEYLSGIAKLRVTGAEARAFANWAGLFAQQKRLSLQAGKLTNLSNMFGTAFPVFASTVLFAVIAFASFDKTDSQFSTGDFIAFNASFVVLLHSMLGLVRATMSVINIAPTYERTLPILRTLPEVDEHKHAPGRLLGAIEISRLRFSYAPNLPPVIDDLSMSIKPGEFIALVGGSGSGKSTLLRLLLGFEQPSQGDIYYDGYNLKDVDVTSVRRQLGVVLQSGRLMSGDIFTNIIGSSTLVLKDAWEAARACGLDKDIEAMPMGMHTVVADGGSTLSGGQRQRLLIARALVHKPAIIFFDEATSALDNQTQAIVSKSMESLKATRVVIAHRLSTIINADRIYVLDQGKVVQSGSYQELMQQEGMFAELAKRQIV